MDINKTLQINTFLKGMNTDTSDALLTPELYREAVNLRISTNTDNNSGELRIVEGTEQFDDYFKNHKQILKVDNIRNYIIVIAVDINDNWAIYRKNINEQNQFVKVTSDISVSDTWGKLIPKLSTVLNWESGENVYMYIADGIHLIMKVNLFPEDVSVNNFDKFIEYLDIVLAPISVSVSLDGGNLPSGKILYSYQLYTKHGNVSKLSPVSKVISVYKNSNSAYSYGEKSKNSADLFIYPSNTTEYEYIKIYRINYQTENEVPTITVVYDGKYKQSITDKGLQYHGTISLAEYTSLSTDIKIKPHIIETKDNYLFAGNIDYVDLENEGVIDEIKSNIKAYFNITIGTVYEGLATVTNQCRRKTFRRGEKYKFGIILYDKKGNQSEVIPWPNIISIDENLIDKPFVEVNEDVEGGYGFNVPTVTLSITNNLANRQKVKDNLSMVELVRAERAYENKSIIGQAMIGHVFKPVIDNNAGSNFSDYNKTVYENRLCPSGFITMLRILQPTWTMHGEDKIRFFQTDLHNIQVICPELLFDKSNFKLSIENNISNISIIPKYIYKIDCEYKLHSIGDYSSYTYYSTKGMEYSLPLTGHNRVYNYFHWLAANQLELLAEVRKSTSGSNDNIFLNSLVYLENICNVSSVIYPQNQANTIIKDFEHYAISESKDPFSFSNNDRLTIYDNPVLIGQNEYIPYTIPYILKMQEGDQRLTDLKNVLKLTYTPSDTNRNLIMISSYPVATGGKCLLLYTQQEIHSELMDITSPNDTTYKMAPITIANITKPYVDYPENPVYYRCGDVIDLRTSSTSVDCSSGDTYNQIMEYNAAHVIYDGTYIRLFTMSTVYQVPIESDIDMSSEFGTSYSKQNNDYRIQDEVVSFPNYLQLQSCYLLNTVYNYINLISTAYEKYEDELEVTNGDARIFVSQKKENGEIIDSWLKFKAADFLDLDYKYGQITDMTTFKNQLIAWQKDATALISVNERALLNSVVDTQIILGTGDKLSRYDYITTSYGMKEDQRCNTQSDTTLYWWDYNRNELLGYSGGNQVLPTISAKNLTNYANTNTKCENPYLIYDSKYKEVVASVYDRSIVYNELLLGFSGIYTIQLGENTTLNNTTYIAGPDNILYKWNANGNNSSFFYTTPITISLKYVVNQQPQYTKTFDTIQYGGRFYGGSIEIGSNNANYDVRRTLDLSFINHESKLDPISFIFKTPLKLYSEASGKDLTSIVEYDYRMLIPRSGQTIYSDIKYGNRMRGKTMQCEIKSSSNSIDFSLQYIITKYRISCS